MIQALSVLIFVAYLLTSPSGHEKFRNRLLWFVGAVLSLIGISTSHQLPTISNLFLLLVGALPLLLAIPHGPQQRR